MAYSTSPSGTVTLSIQTGGISSNDISISPNMKLLNIDINTSCKYTTGLRTTTNLGSDTVIFDSSDFATGAGSTNAMAYLFVRNPITATKATTYVDLKYSSAVISRLYEGQFLWLPLVANTGGDLILNSNSDTEVFEYCIVYEDALNDYVHGSDFGET